MMINYEKIVLDGFDIYNIGQKLLMSKVMLSRQIEFEEKAEGPNNLGPSEKSEAQDNLEASGKSETQK